MDRGIGERTLVKLRRTKLVQWAVAYCASAWAGLQMLDLLAGSFFWADALLRPVTVLAAFGLVGTFVVAWFHGERGRQRVTLLEASSLVTILALAAVSIRFVGFRGPEERGLELGGFERSIAVLPFDNLSPDAEHEFFVNGFHDNLLTRLSGISALRVVSRRAVMRYAESPAALVDVAAELSVGAVLEGSVQRDGTRIRVIVSLVDPRSDTQVWAQSYDRDLHDVFSVQSDITQRVAWALEARLTEEEEERVEVAPTDDVTALDFYMHGIAAYDRMTHEDNMEAVRLFEEAISADPDFAPAHARLADAHMQRIQFFGAGRGVADTARVAANRALELDPDLSLAHKALGFVAWMEGDVEEALSRFYRAVDLDPNSAAAINNAGIANYFLGRIADAKGLLERAYRLEPNMVLVRSNVGAAHVMLEQLDTARVWLDRSLALDPKLPGARNWSVMLEIYEHGPERALVRAEEFAEDRPDEALSWARGALAAVYARRFERALEYLDRAREISPDIRGFEVAPVELLEAVALHGLGRGDEACARYDEYLERLESRMSGGGRGWVMPSRRAVAAALEGDTEETLRWLEEAADAAYPFPALVSVDPSYDLVRDEPRFDRVLQQMREQIAEQRVIAARGD